MKDYVCQCCNKKWIDKTHYNIHMNTKKNTGEPRKTRTHKKPLVKWHCKLCDKPFTCKNNFKKHCLTRFETHAVYANQEVGLDVYKDGYTADGKKISELTAVCDENTNDLILQEYINFYSEDFETELNKLIELIY